MKPQTLDLPEMTAGDHWRALAGGITIQENGAPPSATLASVRIRFKPTDRPANDPAAETRIELTSANASQIVIDNATTWTFHCPIQALALTAGNWTYNIETTDSAGVVSTFVSGAQLVLEDV